MTAKQTKQIAIWLLVAMVGIWLTVDPSMFGLIKDPDNQIQSFQLGKYAAIAGIGVSLWIISPATWILITAGVLAGITILLMNGINLINRR